MYFKDCSIMQSIVDDVYNNKIVDIEEYNKGGKRIWIHDGKITQIDEVIVKVCKSCKSVMWGKITEHTCEASNLQIYTVMDHLRNCIDIEIKSIEDFHIQISLKPVESVELPKLPIFDLYRQILVPYDLTINCVDDIIMCHKIFIEARGGDRIKSLDIKFRNVIYIPYKVKTVLAYVTFIYENRLELSDTKDLYELACYMKQEELQKKCGEHKI